MMFRPSHSLVAPELMAIEWILERHFAVTDPTRITRAILGFDGDYNSAGRIFSIVYRNFDIRKLNFWALDRSQAREFHAEFEFDGKSPFGFMTTFLGILPISTELFSYHIDVPDRIRHSKLVPPRKLGA